MRFDRSFRLVPADGSGLGVVVVNFLMFLVVRCCVSVGEAYGGGCHDLINVRLTCCLLGDQLLPNGG